MKAGKVILGALAGLASGAIAAILFAPEKGSTTRKHIRHKADDYAGGLKSKYHQLRDSLKSKFKRTKEDAEKLADKGKEKYYDAKEDVEVAEGSFKHPGGADVNY
ncbi:MAG: YtxH domain-containing protein [Bacteroidales bacterium]